MNLRLSENWRPIVIGALVLPACLAAVNHFTLRHLATFSSLEDSFITAVSLVIQLGVAAWVLAAIDLSKWLRTTIYIWCLGLIDLQVIIMAFDSTSGSGWSGTRDRLLMPPAALFAGQIGMLCVWGILGSGPAIVRMPFCVIPAWGLWWIWNYCSSGRSAWHNTITLQVSALVLLCLALRLVGFRLSRTDVDESNGKQFGLQHMLVATSLLAVIFTLARVGAPLMSDAFSGIRLWKIFLALTAAFCMVIAVWAALGKEGTIKRMATFTVLAIGAGLLSWNDSQQFLATPNPWRVDRERYMLGQLGVWWIGWFLISPATLTSILLYLRFSGYHLAHRWFRSPSMGR